MTTFMPTARMNAMSSISESRFASVSITEPPSFTSTTEPWKSRIYGKASVKTAAFATAVSIALIEMHSIP